MFSNSVLYLLNFVKVVKCLKGEVKTKRKHADLKLYTFLFKTRRQDKMDQTVSFLVRCM